MKKSLRFFLMTAWLIFLCGFAKTQTFPVDTLQYNGDISKFINIVILSDGYQSSELTTFQSDAVSFMTSFFADSPFGNYQNYFNVFTVSVPSNQSGAKHPNTAPDCPTGPPQPIIDPDNYFGSTFDAYSIHRLVVPMNFSNITSVLSSNFPMYDIVLILVNSPYYGGSGGFAATSTTEYSANEICLHEIGHSFGNLADEYWVGAGYAAEKANMTQQSSPALIRWKHWLGYNSIGIYPHSGDPTWFKPSQGCKMQYLGVPFCSVCQEAIVETIHNLVNPVLSYTPSTPSVTMTTSDITFKLNLIKPLPNTLRSEWKLDGATFANNIDSVIITPASLTNGTHPLNALVLDTTALTRDSLHQTTHLHIVQWSIIKGGAGISTSADLNELLLQIFPNPCSDKLEISFDITEKSKVGFDLIDISGKIIKTRKAIDYPAGQHSISITNELSGLTTGVYYLKFNINGFIITRPVILQK